MSPVPAQHIAISPIFSTLLWIKVIIFASLLYKISGNSFFKALYCSIDALVPKTF